MMMRLPLLRQVGNAGAPRGASKAVSLSTPSGSHSQLRQLTALPVAGWPGHWQPQRKPEGS
eukprot:8873-Rhodomonas_salina.1